MHELHFDIKRVYLCDVAFNRKVLARYGLTPARYDLLCVIAGCADGFMVPQNILHRRLGVTAPVVSRMLKSLRELGFVHRQPDVFMGNQKVVTLERKAYAALKAIQREQIRSGATQLVVDCIVSPRFRSPKKRAVDHGRLTKTLRHMRAQLGDTATFVPPPRPHRRWVEIHLRDAA